MTTTALYADGPTEIPGNRTGARGARIGTHRTPSDGDLPFSNSDEGNLVWVQVWRNNCRRDAQRLLNHGVRPSAVGAISFNVVNQGTMTHELDIYQSSLPLDGLPMTSSQTVDESSSKVKIIEVSAPMPAGTSQTIDVTLKLGTYYFVCNQAGHYKLGMRLEYVVK